MRHVTLCRNIDEQMSVQNGCKESSQQSAYVHDTIGMEMVKTGLYFVQNLVDIEIIATRCGLQNFCKTSSELL